MTVKFDTIKEQTLEQKLNSFFDAIKSIETQEDGSIVVEWKANVAHHVAGHLVTYTEKTQVQQGKEIHFNPNVGEINFNNIDEQLKEAKSDDNA